MKSIYINVISSIVVMTNDIHNNLHLILDVKVSI